MPHVAGGLDPSKDGVADVDQGFFRCLAIAHAAGQVGNEHEEAAAVFRRQRLNDYGIVQSVHVSFATASRKRTSCRIYTGLIGRAKGIDSFSRIRGWATL